MLSFFVRSVVVAALPTVFVSGLLAGCPKTTLVGEPCGPDDEAGPCEGTQKLRCNGRFYEIQAPCHFDCLEELPLVPHEQETIAQDTTWACGAGAHVVTGTVIVGAGATLTIEPGASVRIDPSSRIDVDADGRVVVDATAGAPVTVTSNNGEAAGFGSSTSGGLNVPATEAPALGSILKHLIVERGIHGLGIFGLSSTTVPPLVQDCTFRDNQNFGIKVACAEADAPVPDFAASCADAGADARVCGNQFFGNGVDEVSSCAE